MQEIFRTFSQRTSSTTGSPVGFGLAVGVIVLWAIMGPFFAYSNSWQLVINTGTTIITFLMVFLIQNTQNRDSRAMHLKLDELLRAQADARTSLVELETLTDAELDRLQAEFSELRKYASAEAERRSKDGDRTGRRLADQVHA